MLLLQLGLALPSLLAQAESLEAAFRFPLGGKPVAGPLLDRSSSPGLVWTISEDHGLYALSEAGKVVTRIELPGEGKEILSLDPFGRAAVCSGSRLSLYTRLGSLVWSWDADGPLLQAPVYGSDGRLFIATAQALVCLSPAGRPLWSRKLAEAAATMLGVDSLGNPVVGLRGGSLLLLGAQGQERGRMAAGGELLCIAAPGGEPGRLAFAAGLEDGQLLLFGPDDRLHARIAAGARSAASSPSSRAIIALQWSGELLIGLERGGRVFAVSAAGAPVWSADSGCPEGRLGLFATRIVVTARGRAVSLSDRGEILREANVVHAAGAGTVSSAGLLFSPGEDWILAAYRFERPLGRALQPSPRPYPRAEGVAEEVLSYDPAAGDSAHQLFLLADIEKSLRSGTIGADEGRAAAYCSALALGAFQVAPADNVPGAAPVFQRRLRANPLPRARACALLGMLGSPDNRGPLCAVLAGDEDGAVRAAACEALGAIGVDPDGLTARAFLAAALRPIDEETALALMGAIETLALSSGTPPAVETVRALLALADRPYSARVRDRAAQVLGRMAGAVGR